MKKYFNLLKRDIKRFFKFISTYIYNNKIYCIYALISSVLFFTIRLLTTNVYLTIYPILVDLALIFILGSFSFFFKTHLKRFIYLECLLTLHSVVCVINAIYYTYYASFASITELGSLGQVKTVKEAFYEHLNPLQFIYLIAPIVFYFIYKKLKKKLPDIKRGKKYIRQKFWKTFLVSILIASLSFVTASRSDYSRLYKQWNRPYVVNRFGLILYHTMDIVNYLSSHVTTIFGMDNALYETQEFLNNNTNYKESNKYTGMFEGHNIIFVHMESIQSFLFDLSFNGEYVLPTTRKLASEGMYFSNFYPQISLGTSSDTEFSLLTSLMPSNTGTVFTNFYNRKYVTLTKLLNNKDYYTFSMHGNDFTMWNRINAHPNLGYKGYYFKDKYDVTEEESMNLGITDSAFFKQSMKYLEDIEKNNTNYMGTVITLSNHSPYIFLDKYKEYDLSKEYQVVDPETDNVSKQKIDYLTGTSIGNYIISSHSADLALGEFIKYIEESEYFNNTIFVFYGDHDPRLSSDQYNYFYNYDPVSEDLLSSDDPDYYDYNEGRHIENRKTPLIIWSKNENIRNLIQGEIDYPMGMIDIMPTIGNMLNINNPYAIGYDIFNIKENNIVSFPNGDFITKDYIYDCSKDTIYDIKTKKIIEKEDLNTDKIEELKDYVNDRISISNNIIHYDLINIIEKNNLIETSLPDGLSTIVKKEQG
jgi:phosphoglycerol transferase MdoB-like AlkP superfamily enzyme